MTDIKYEFGGFTFSFNIYGDTDIDINNIHLACHSKKQGLIFYIANMKIHIYNFPEAKRFFEFSNSLDDFSEIKIAGFRTYPFKEFDKLTSYKLTDKLKEFTNSTKLEEQTDTYDQKIYEFIEHLFSEHNSVQLVFVD